jgi:hypothetical protein
MGKERKGAKRSAVEHREHGNSHHDSRHSNYVTPTSDPGQIWLNGTISVQLLMHSLYFNLQAYTK